jgi:hypothetical protein
MELVSARISRSKSQSGTPALGAGFKHVDVLQPHMSVSGACEICTTADVEHTCNRCATLVCDHHFDEDTGYCVECTTEVGRPGGEHIPQSDDMPDGVDTYEF